MSGATATFWDEDAVAIDLLDELLHQPLRPLVGGGLPDGPGIYLLFLQAPPLPEVYEAVAGPSSCWPVYAGKAQLSVAARTARHIVNIDHTSNLSSDRVWMASLELGSPESVVYAEVLVLKHLKPVWNTVLTGFTSCRQGATRRTQRLPRHALLHPSPNVGAGAPLATVEAVKAEAWEHLRRTVPIGGGWPALPRVV